LPLVVCKLYFLSPHFYLLSNVVPVLWEKMQMVPLSIFPSKINRNLCQRHVAHSKCDTWPQYIYIRLLKKNKNCRGGSSTPFGPHGGGGHSHLAWGWFCHPHTSQSWGDWTTPVTLNGNRRSFFLKVWPLGVAEPPT